MGEPMGHDPGPGGPRAYDVGAVRELLLAAFGPQTLYRMCLDHPPFQPVIAQFAPSDGVMDMADKLLGYCLQMSLFDELIDAVREENPRQVERFEPQLVRPGVSPATSAPEAVLDETQVLLARGQEDEAIRLLRQAHQAHPYHREIEGQLLAALYEKGSRDHVRGRYNEALLALEEVSKIDPFYQSLP
jgi:tetratricopeptide (TPR) repeat protein